jgi:molybdopterin-guanine dinucleotide biosynthesis protein A
MPGHATAAAIIAGGRARRFGGADKGRLVVRGVPIIVRQVEVLQRVAAPVFVVAGDAARFADLGLDVRADIVPEAGAIGGIYTALEYSPCEHVLAVACDQPFLSADLLARLSDLAADGDGAWVRGPAGVEPLVACYRKQARERIRRRIDAGRLKAADLGEDLRMVELTGEELAAFGSVAELLANINSPDEYARVQ